MLLMVVLIILIVILYIKFIMSGAELLVLKYAIPILSVGLMDSDNGTFGVAVKKFFQVGFTCSLQIILLRFAIALLLTLHPIWAIAFTSLAISTPKLIQEFLFMRPGGSGIGGKVQMLTNIKRMIS
ncbi:MAG: DUF6102 family protein [Lachnospiraceae bacterium]|nr:DUF6102 family protein [Lachnospiraceae bacterium]